MGREMTSVGRVPGDFWFEVIGGRSYDLPL